ncbi:MAG: dihydropteroate synthase [Cryomorphaceae bacterium BACL21 MAG-121220-bin10]|jgi:dihydropteroate synthase|nr:MAG: dihydropteroate synthase [Cryomorphaceae bacterium BACL21 MAG-121220-bin10]
MTINCHGHLIDLSVPRVMGILNVTPDSFYDGGKHNNLDTLLAQAAVMLADGATFLDVGGYSSRPGADDVNLDQEIGRVLPAIKALHQTFPQALISIDTFRSSVAQAAIDAGACMVNDISGGQADPDMFAAVGSASVPMVLMHMRGTPQTMTSLSQYDNVIIEVTQELATRIAQARSHGINDLIIDPGFGFAKTRAQNFELLNQLEHLIHLKLPILAGLSRKSMIYKTLDKSPEQALNGTTVMNTIALQKGACILRVHDVAQAQETISLVQALKN